jgi:hypothetical protein
MHRLKTTIQHAITIASFISYHKKFIIMQFLNTYSLKLHFQDILNNPNLFASHILCLNKQKYKIVKHIKRFKMLY